LHLAVTELSSPPPSSSALPRLSVLDLAPVVSGSTAGEALRSSLDLARRVEELGYERYWVAEHHNMPGIASSAPAVLLAHVASVTSTIRVGSGGVMLPNHSSLVIAEQFGMLEALHPGRVDLGIGRAPGTDPLTARALRRVTTSGMADDFPEQLVELIGYFTGRFPESHPYRHIHATPGRGHAPALWLLGSSDYSARAAGQLGLPFSFAHHFAPANTEAAVEVYRRSFRPSDDLDEPYVMLGVAVVAAETDERAAWLAAPGGLGFLRLRQGRPGPYPTPEEAAAFNYTPSEEEAIRAWTASHVVGGPDTVAAGLRDLAERTGADELMITTMVSPHAERVRSYEIVAELGGLAHARAAA
jgi:luciferase family oxidoreductase group 1